VRVGIVIFPGSLDEIDAARAVRLAGAEPVPLWHADEDLYGVDAVVLPGGFSYGDYLRCGAIARFAPVMSGVTAAAETGTPVLGICNGFQILCEAGLLPGALTRNEHLRFRHRDQLLRVETAATAWTNAYDPGQQLLIPIKSGEGRYVADPAILDELASAGQVVASYIGGNPNGSLRDIAAISNAAGNVVGIMPHPEHATDPLTGPSTDGLGFFTSVLKHLAGAQGGADADAQGGADADAEAAAEAQAQAQAGTEATAGAAA
jgi:phosphoribosylformylglycinamidine synthase